MIFSLETGILYMFLILPESDKGVRVQVMQNCSKRMCVKKKWLKITFLLFLVSFFTILAHLSSG